MARRGRELETLIKTLERLINKSPNTTIISPAFLTDKITGEKREHDVLIRIKQDHHEFLTSIECKDWNTKVGSPIVEAFAEKCRDSGIHRGIIVSSKGFFAPALKKAQMKNIECFNLNSLENFDWCKMQTMSAITRYIDNIHLQINFTTPHEKEETELFFRNEIITIELVKSIAINALEQININENIEIEKCEINITNIEEFTAKVRGKEYIAHSVIISFDYKKTVEQVPLKFLEYKDQVAKNIICQTLITSSIPGPIGGQIAFVKKENSDFMEVHLLPNNDQS